MIDQKPVNYLISPHKKNITLYPSGLRDIMNISKSVVWIWVQMQYYGIETSPTPFVQTPALQTAVFHSNTLVINDILFVKLRILPTQKTVHHTQGNKKFKSQIWGNIWAQRHGVK